MKEGAPEGARGNALAGMRILVLEDEPIISMDLELELGDADVGLVCRAETVGEAVAVIDGGDIDAAVLDYSLMSRKNAEPVARRLDHDGIPYIFYSGDLDRHGEAIRRFGRPVVAKPAPAGEVLRVLRGVVGRG